MKKKNTTIELNGDAITKISGTYCAVQNLGVNTIYVSPCPTANADDGIAVLTGCSVVISHNGVLYLSGTGKVQLIGSDNPENPFKSVNAGAGGSGVDETARAAIEAHVSNKETHVTAEDRAAWNAKAELSDIPTWLPANGGNADTLENHPASDFAQPLRANKTVYVATTGSDTTGDGTQANPWATIQKAVDECPLCGGFMYTINIAAGEYAAPYVSGADKYVNFYATDSVTFAGCTTVANGARINFNGKIVLAGTTSHATWFMQNANIRFNGNLTIRCSAANARGIMAGIDTNVSQESGTLTFENCAICVRCNFGSSVCLNTVTGTGNTSGFEAQVGGVITYASAAGLETTNLCVTSGGGRIYSGVQPTAYPADGGNADTLENHPASDFAQRLGMWSTGDFETLALDCVSGCAWVGKSVTGMPTDNTYWFVSVQSPLSFSLHRAVTAINLDGKQYINSYDGGPETWSGWKAACDGGNASLLETHPASDFVLKSEYEALAARVAALETQ